MKYNMYAIFDRAVDAYVSQFFAETDVEAQRMVTSVVSNPDTILADHPQYYRLDRLATFDRRTGVVQSEAVPVHVAEVEQLQRQVTRFELNPDESESVVG